MLDGLCKRRGRVWQTKKARSLKAFMREELLWRDPVKYVASKRMKDDDGKPIEWELRC